MVVVAVATAWAASNARADFVSYASNNLSPAGAGLRVTLEINFGFYGTTSFVGSQPDLTPTALGWEIALDPIAVTARVSMIYFQTGGIEQTYTISKTVGIGQVKSFTLTLKVDPVTLLVRSPSVRTLVPQSGGYYGTTGPARYVVIGVVNGSYTITGPTETRAGRFSTGLTTSSAGDPWIGTANYPAQLTIQPSGMFHVATNGYSINETLDGEQVAAGVHSVSYVNRNGPTEGIMTPGSLGPLIGLNVTTHSADTDRDFRINLLELTRVIAIYNTRNGGTRTGCYKLQSGTEDGFAPDSTRGGDTIVTFSSYHAADWDFDGRISFLELTRILELYNSGAGKIRTGQYHVRPGTEDGFDPGP